VVLAAAIAAEVAAAGAAAATAGSTSLLSATIRFQPFGFQLQPFDCHQTPTRSSLSSVTTQLQPFGFPQPFGFHRLGLHS
jgi:hypothetical protein